MLLEEKTGAHACTPLPALQASLNWPVPALPPPQAAHESGAPVMRPLWMNFPENAKTHGISRWGSHPLLSRALGWLCEALLQRSGLCVAATLLTGARLASAGGAQLTLLLRALGLGCDTPLHPAAACVCRPRRTCHFAWPALHASHAVRHAHPAAHPRRAEQAVHAG